MSDFSKMPFNWAGEQALTEAEAFEWAVKSAKIKKAEFEIDDKYEQAYRKGKADQLKEDERLIAENAELRDMIKQQAQQINRLREAIRRGSEDFWD